MLIPPHLNRRNRQRTDLKIFIMSDSDLSGLITRLENLKPAVPKDGATRKSLFETARSLMLALETPGDSVQRIAYTVSLPFWCLFYTGNPTLIAYLFNSRCRLLRHALPAISICLRSLPKRANCLRVRRSLQRPPRQTRSSLVSQRHSQFCCASWSTHWYMSMGQGRFLRYLASFGINEKGEDSWSASNITKTLSVPGSKAGIVHKS